MHTTHTDIRCGIGISKGVIGQVPRSMYKASRLGLVQTDDTETFVFDQFFRVLTQQIEFGFGWNMRNMRLD